MMENILKNKGDLEIGEKNEAEYTLLNCAVEEKNENSFAVILELITKLKDENEEIGNLIYF